MVSRGHAARGSCPPPPEGRVQGGFVVDVNLLAANTSTCATPRDEAYGRRGPETACDAEDPTALLEDDQHVTALAAALYAFRTRRRYDTPAEPSWFGLL